MLPCDALVVDDDPDGREALSELLAAHGYRVRQAANGRVALAMISERLPCLVLLDLEMPVMSGWEVLASLRRAGALPAIRVVVLSAAASPPPGVEFVRKPCRVDDLLGIVHGRGHGHAAGAEALAGRP